MATEQNFKFLSQGQLDDMAEHYSEAEQSVTLEQEQWLLFSLGKELFSISMNELDEIALVSGGIAIPSIKKHVIGLISLRGEPMVLVDTSKALGLKATEKFQQLQRVLVLKDDDGKPSGFLVDSIIKVTELSNWQDHAESEQQHYHSRFVEAITEYSGNGVSRLNPAELIRCINE